MSIHNVEIRSLRVGYLSVIRVYLDELAVFVVRRASSIDTGRFRPNEVRSEQRANLFPIS